jgi:hypothetical protein
MISVSGSLGASSNSPSDARLSRADSRSVRIPYAVARKNLP